MAKAPKPGNKGRKKPPRSPGRPKGPNKLTRAQKATIHEVLVGADLTPLDVMLENMRFFHREGATIVQAILARGQEEMAPADLVAMLGTMTKLKMSAQACAVDAAPYIHQRLALLTVEKEKTPEELDTTTTWIVEARPERLMPPDRPTAPEELRDAG